MTQYVEEAVVLGLEQCMLTGNIILDARLYLVYGFLPAPRPCPVSFWIVFVEAKST